MAVEWVFRYPATIILTVQRHQTPILAADRYLASFATFGVSADILAYLASSNRLLSRLSATVPRLLQVAECRPSGWEGEMVSYLPQVANPS